MDEEKRVESNKKNRERRGAASETKVIISYNFGYFIFFF